MGLYDYFFGPTTPPGPTPAQQQAAARAAAARAHAKVTQAQIDAQQKLNPNMVVTGILPCGLPILAHPCDLKDLKITERKNGSYDSPWVGKEAAPKERETTKEFTIETKGKRDEDPYVTGTIIEVTAGSPKDFRKTTIDVLVEEDYKFCSQEQHPHIVIIDPEGKNTTLKATKKHTMQVFRKARATDESRFSNFLDVWPVRLGFQDYRVAAIVCGVRKGGPAVRSQNTAIRVFPNDQWELEVKCPSLLGASVTHSTNRADPAHPSSETVTSGTVNLPHSVGTAKSTWTTEDGHTTRVGKREMKPAGGEDGDVETRVKVELKRNEQTVADLEWITTAINAFKHIEKTINEIEEAIKKYKPKVGWDFAFKVEALTGVLKATWGFKEAPERQVFFAYSVTVKMVLVKVSFAVSFGVDMTIKGYGFIANIEGKVEGKLEVNETVERKSMKDAEWKHAQFKSDFPATLTAKGMAISDRVLSLSASCETGFESGGHVGFDEHGFGILVDKVEFKGVTLKGRATVISLFDADVEYKVLDKRKVGGPMRFPS